MADVKLVINGREFPLYYKMLASLAQEVPDNANYRPLIKALLDLDIPSITSELVRRGLLDGEEMDAVWEKGNIDARRRLTDSVLFLKNLTDAQAREIIDLGDVEILKHIAKNAERLYPSRKDENQAKCLSGQMADALFEFISGHPDSDVRNELWDNRYAPAKFKAAFRERVINRDFQWRIEPDNMGMDDLDVLKSCALNILSSIADSVEDIRDRKVRARVVEFLYDHPDPQIRLQLAENISAPESALRKLASDPDQDVARAAAKNLDEEDE